MTKKLRPADRLSPLPPAVDPRTGVDVPRALDLLAAAGYRSPHVALAMHVTHGTVQHWRKGRYTPTVERLARLRELVLTRKAVLLEHRDITVPAVALELGLLDHALDALTSDAQRAEEQALADRIIASLEAATARHAGRRSITTQVDPFELIALSDPKQLEIPF